MPPDMQPASASHLSSSLQWLLALLQIEGRAEHYHGHIQLCSTFRGRVACLGENVGAAVVLCGVG